MTKIYNTYHEWFVEYRDAYRSENGAECIRLAKAEPVFAKRLEMERRDPQWYYTSEELKATRVEL